MLFVNFLIYETWMILVDFFIDLILISRGHLCV